MLLSNWKPASEAQRLFLSSEAEIICYGGSAGTYKTESLLVDAATEYDDPKCNAVLFRTSFPELESKIIPRSRELYSQLGGTYNSQTHSWHWPWGACVKFAYLERDDDVYTHQGAEYSWIGFDESTHRTEFQIRYLLSRSRSTDPLVFCRARLATNPGGPGHKMHQHVFLGGSCPHCQTPVRKPLEIYKDATWLSDKKAIEMSTQYIFGVWDPNGLLPNYGKQLRMQSGSLAKALLEGCWRSFEGQYYDIWEPNRPVRPMVVPRATIGDQYWWPHWVGADYGFSGSSAAAYLFCMSPEGIVYCIDEYIAKHQDVRAWARDVYNRFVKKRDWQEQPRHLAAMFLSPDCWNDRGDYRPLAGQMNEEIESTGAVFAQARNDRAGGAMLIYTMLQGGGLVIADTCSVIQESLESRIHDEKEPEKVMKVVGDPLDDAFDGFRYGVYSYQPPERAPREMRIAQEVSKAYNSDPVMGPTMAVIKHMKMLREEEDDDEPVFLGGSARRRMQAEQKKKPVWYRE